MSAPDPLEHRGKQPGGRTVAGRRWKFEDARARFREVVRLARSAGPQIISVRGEDVVGVIGV